MECNKALQAMLVLGIVMFIIAASAIFTTNYLQKENVQLKDYNYKLLTARADNRPAQNENTSIAKPITPRDNFSLGREFVEALLKQQNPDKTISFKGIRCDATLTYYDPTTTENDGYCYVEYTFGEWR